MEELHGLVTGFCIRKSIPDWVPGNLDRGQDIWAETEAAWRRLEKSKTALVLEAQKIRCNYCKYI